MKKAYDDLKDPKRRKRYRAGLAFEAAHKKEEGEEGAVKFQVPKSCGMVTVKGDTDYKGRFVVQQIGFVIVLLAGLVHQHLLRSRPGDPPPELR